MPLLPIVKMTKTVIKSLLGGSACKMYPARKPAFFGGTRGPVEIDPSNCVLCGLCAKKCPAGAIAVDREGKTWEIDRLKCIVCGLCADSCPKKCLVLRNDYTPPVTGETKDVFRIAPVTKEGCRDQGESKG